MVPEELADAEALWRLTDWEAVPGVDAATRIVRSSSTQRPQRPGVDLPLLSNGNADNNAFVCASDDAVMAEPHLLEPWLDLDKCREPYVRGFVTTRFEGSGALVRLWMTTLSLIEQRADNIILRLYVDDEIDPVVQVPLVTAIDGSASPMFAPPFGAGSSHMLAWYYPVVFSSKLVVSIDAIPANDLVYHQADVRLDPEREQRRRADAALPERQGAAAVLGSETILDGDTWVDDMLTMEPGATTTLLERTGPGTVTAVSVTVDDDDISKLDDLRLSVDWDSAASFEVTLAELFGATRAAPVDASLALAGEAVAGGRQRITLRLPMPFAVSARWSVVNAGRESVSFTFGASGISTSLADAHFQLSAATSAEPAEASHRLTDLAGPVRVVGTCLSLAGYGLEGDPLSNGLNFLEGDETIALDDIELRGTGTEDYLDGAFYFADGPHARPFSHTWGIEEDNSTTRKTGAVSGCRWHLFGGELDATDRVQFDLEIGPNQPRLLELYRTTVYWYG